jgi:hypothetical protein
VLFADLVGYTAWGQQLDAEEVHALLEQFFDRVDRVVQEHGGHIVRHIGDCVMAVFGAPVAHDNDAERAARAALAIQAAIPEVSVRVGRPVGVHMGVAGGQVVARRTGSASYSEYTVTGNAANLASRLTDAAEADEILVSDETHGALAERFDCVDAGTLGEAMALGGLGDAEYVRGRMISAYDRFRQCVELCRCRATAARRYERRSAGNRFRQRRAAPRQLGPAGQGAATTCSAL